jgi:hypothetical protein
MREETMAKLTTGEKHTICQLINEDNSSEIFATLESMQWFQSEYVYFLVETEAETDASLLPVLSKLQE